MPKPIKCLSCTLLFVRTFFVMYLNVVHLCAAYCPFYVFFSNAIDTSLPLYKIVSFYLIKTYSIPFYLFVLGSGPSFESVKPGVEGVSRRNGKG